MTDDTSRRQGLTERRDDSMPGLRSMPSASLVTAAAIGVLLFVIGWLAPVIAPVGLGLFLAALAAPFFGWLGRRGLPAPIALSVTIGVVVLIGALILVLIVLSVRSLDDSLERYAADIQSRYAAAGLDPLTDLVGRLLPADTAAEVLVTVVSTLIDVAVGAGFAIVVAALLLLDGRRLASVVALRASTGDPLVRQFPRVAEAAVTYFVVRIRVNLITAVALFGLMLLLGVDDALLWAVGAFFLSFIPYIGLVVALIPPTILAFAETGIGAAAAVVIGGTVLNLVAENILEPTLTGRALKLATWFVFVMFFLTVWLLGPIGALLSMPISVLLALLLRESEGTEWVASLLARDAPEGPGGPPEETPDPTGVG